MAPRVLVTRPEPGASQTAKRLAETGFQPVVLPLSEIVASAVEQIPEPDAFDIVALTSANAARHAPPALAAAFAEKTCYAVGDGTAEAARAAGFRDVVAGPGDAPALAARIVRDAPGARVLYPCGRVRRDTFENSLKRNGIACTAVETYDTRAIECDGGAALEALGNQPLHAALVHSAFGAERLLGLMARPGLAGFFEETIFLCLSERIAAALADGGRLDLRVADAPSEDALFRLLAATGR